MILGVDASNLTAGGGVSYLRGLLAHAPQGVFDEVLVFGRPELARELDLAPDGPARLIPQAALSSSVWRSLSGFAAAGYAANLVRVGAWRHRVLPRLLEEHRVGVLLSPGGLLPGACGPQIRLVSMSHNALLFDRAEMARYGFELQRLRLELLRRSQLGGFRRADGVIFLSRHVLERAAGILPGIRDRAAVIPNGVGPEWQASPRGDRDPRTLLYVSTIDRYKHQDRVVQAMASLVSEGADLNLRLVGPVYAPVGRSLRELVARLGLQSRVEVTGAVPPRDLPSFHDQADLFVFASSCENCPMALLEAMAAGMPVACSRRPPMPEFAGDCAEYFDPEDPGSIADAVGRLISDPIRRRESSARGRELASSYTWERCAGDTFEFLAQVASSPKAASLARQYWETRACGTRHASSPPGTAEHYQEADRFRYGVEPVAAFAGFSGQRSKRVLEVGTGMGADLKNFLSGGAEAMGVDLSPAALEATRRRLDLEGLPIRLCRGDAGRLPFRTGSFDLVWSWGVLHHAVPMEAAVEEVLRVLRPGGEARLMLYHRPSWVALAAWARWGLLSGRPFIGMRRAVADHVESPGTLALTRAEIVSFLEGFDRVDVRVVASYWDAKFVPLLGRLGGSKLGWFALVRAFKPQAPQAGG